MDGDDDDFFVVIIGDEDKQKQKIKEPEKKKLQTIRNNTEEINEKENFTSALNLIDNATQHEEVETEPVKAVGGLEDGECLSIKSEPEDSLEEGEFNLRTDEKLESSTDDNLLVPTVKKRKRVAKPKKAFWAKPKRKNIMVEIPVSVSSTKRKRAVKPIDRNIKVEIPTSKKRKLAVNPKKKKKVEIATSKKRKLAAKSNKRKKVEIEIPAVPAVPAVKKPELNRFRLKPEHWTSYIEEMRQQFPELNEDEDLLVETLRGILGEVKAPPPPKEYFIMNDTMYECLFCNVNTCTARMAEVHYQEKHGPTYLFCFACGANYRRKIYLYRHEEVCKAKDAPILLKARDLLLKRKKSYIPESEPTLKEETTNINTEDEEFPKSKPTLEEETPNTNPEYEGIPKSEPDFVEDTNVNLKYEEFPESEPALEEDNPSIDTEEEEFLNSDHLEDETQTLNIKEEESESDNNITIEVPKYEKRKVRRAPIESWQQRSYIKELREEHPELREDKELLIETLSRIMRSMKPPPPPQDYFVMKGVMFECIFCGAETNTMGAAGRHFQHKHGTRYLVCFACGVDFANTTDLYKHEKRCRAPDAILLLKARARALGPRGRSRPYLTEHKFRMSSTYVKRIRRRYIKSPDSARFKCDLCSSHYGTMASLQAHLNLHGGVRPHKCRHCPSAYTSKIALNHHMSKHTDVKFICDLCSRSFRLKKTLVVHMATHYPTRHNICEYCGRSYIQKVSLTQHVNKKHLKMQPSFLCHICDKRYWKNSTLKMHMKKEHESTLVTRNMFIKKLPTLSEAELNEAKLIYDSDFTKINDTILLPEDGIIVKPPPEKKKRGPRRKAENVNNENKKKAKKGEIENTKGDANPKGDENPKGDQNPKGDVHPKGDEHPKGDDNPKAIIKNLSKDIVVKKIKEKKQRKSKERDVIKYFAIQPMDDVVTLNEGFKRKYKTNDTPKKIYFSNIHKTPGTETELGAYSPKGKMGKR